MGTLRQLSCEPRGPSRRNREGRTGGPHRDACTLLTSEPRWRVRHSSDGFHFDIVTPYICLVPSINRNSSGLFPDIGSKPRWQLINRDGGVVRGIVNRRFGPKVFDRNHQFKVASLDAVRLCGALLKTQPDLIRQSEFVISWRIIRRLRLG